MAHLLRMIQPMATLTRSAGRLTGVGTSWLRRVGASRAADSPTRLQAAAALTVLCALALSLGGFYSVERRATAIDDAAGAASQLIRVQDVRVVVVQADSLASVAYLVGGQEPAAQRQEYDDRIDVAARGLSEAAAAATGADTVALENATSLLATYVGLIEQARANNRQGFPVGAAYQRQARVVAEQLVEQLRSVETTSRDRVNESVRRGHRASALLIVTALVLVLVLAFGSWWLARRWRRVLNVPLVVAGVIVGLVTIVGLGVNAAAIDRTDDATAGPLAAADLLAQARASGFDARSNEALTLIARGNGAAYEQQWQLSASIVDQAIAQSCGRFDSGCEAGDAFAAYRDQVAAVRGLDVAGDWDSAVQASLGTYDGGPNSQIEFERFAVTSGAALQEQADEAVRQFGSAGDALDTLAWLIVAAGLSIAALAVIGYQQRLREYR
jgi:hypothetical protein